MHAFEFVYAAPELENSIGLKGSSPVCWALPRALTRSSSSAISPFASSGRAARHSQLTRADRDLLRDGDQRYQDQLFDHAYREWIDQRTLPSPGSIPSSTLVQKRQKMAFKTHLLPEPYDISGTRFHQQEPARKWNHPRKRSFHQRFRSKFQFQNDTNT